MKFMCNVNLVFLICGSHHSLNNFHCKTIMSVLPGLTESDAQMLCGESNEVENEEYLDTSGIIIFCIYS